MIQQCAERAHVPLPLSLLLLEENLLKLRCYPPPVEVLILALSPEEVPNLLEWPIFVVVARFFLPCVKRSQSSRYLGDAVATTKQENYD